MAGLVPAIHVLLLFFLTFSKKEDVDARDKRGMTLRGLDQYNSCYPE
jgi:hypothetical protein